jgi:hypothetical protein
MNCQIESANDNVGTLRQDYCHGIQNSSSV